MSKSLGNILDPLELIPKYGTDAVRLSLLIGNTPGQDTRLSEQKIEGYRNFTNKLWNISRFIMMQMQDESQKANGTETIADRWILSRLSEVVASVTKKLETYQFSAAGEELRDFTWNDLADWYLEIAKVEKGKVVVLNTVLQTVLKLWHPFMPFVTEYIWSVAGFEGKLIVAEWPSVEMSAVPSDFDRLRTLVVDMRRLRAEQGVEAAKQVEFSIVGDQGFLKLVEENRAWIERLTNSICATGSAIPEGWDVAPSGTATVGLNLAGAVDLEKEKAKLGKELDQLKKYVASTEGKLSNQEFTTKAPVHVINEMKAKLEEAKTKIETLEKPLNLRHLCPRYRPTRRKLIGCSIGRLRTCIRPRLR